MTSDDIEGHIKLQSYLKSTFIQIKIENRIL